MATLEQIRQLTDRASQFEFPYCDVKHEDFVRDAQGRPKSKPAQFAPQCPAAVSDRRPACPHQCKESGDALWLLSSALSEHGQTDQSINEMQRQYSRDRMRKSWIDREMRAARTVFSFLMSDPEEQAALAQQESAQFVAEHRAIVDRMRLFRDTLVTAAEKILVGNHTEK